MSDLHNPIVVMGLNQSDLTLVARILAEHGVWTGVCSDSSGSLAQYCENLEIKRWVQKNVDRGQDPLLTEYPLHPGFRPMVLSTLERQGYKGGPWLAKQSICYWQLWDEFSPRFVLPRRSVSDVADSGIGAGFSSSRHSATELRRAVKKLDRRAEQLHRSRGGILLDMDELSLDSISNMLSQLEIRPDESLVMSLLL